MSKAKKNKITKEELEYLNKIIGASHELQRQIGELELSKANLMAQYAKVDEGLVKFKNDINEKYGEVRIEFSTGEYTEIESSEETAE
jgi:hypothetical protein